MPGAGAWGSQTPRELPATASARKPSFLANPPKVCRTFSNAFGWLAVGIASARGSSLLLSIKCQDNLAL